jgi:hypothetical protein
MSGGPEFRFLVAIGKEAERVCASLVESLTVGTPQDFAGYQFLRGQLEAWRAVLAFAKAENDKMMKD